MKKINIDPKLKLLVTYNQFQDFKKRDEWVRSLPLEYRKLLTDSLSRTKTALF